MFIVKGTTRNEYKEEMPGPSFSYHHWNQESDGGNDLLTKTGANSKLVPSTIPDAQTNISMVSWECHISTMVNVNDWQVNKLSTKLNQDLGEDV